MSPSRPGFCFMHFLAEMNWELSLRQAFNIMEMDANR